MADRAPETIAALGARLRAAAHAGDLVTARALAKERHLMICQLAADTPEPRPAIAGPPTRARLAALIAQEHAADADLLEALARQRQTLAKHHANALRMRGSGARIAPAPLARDTATR